MGAGDVDQARAPRHAQTLMHIAAVTDQLIRTLYLRQTSLPAPAALVPPFRAATSRFAEKNCLQVDRSPGSLCLKRWLPMASCSASDLPQNTNRSSR